MPYKFLYQTAKALVGEFVLLPEADSVLIDSPLNHLGFSQAKQLARAIGQYPRGRQHDQVTPLLELASVGRHRARFGRWRTGEAREHEGGLCAGCAAGFNDPWCVSACVDLTLSRAPSWTVMWRRCGGKYPR